VYLSSPGATGGGGSRPVRWDGGLGTPWYSDPQGEMVAILPIEPLSFRLTSEIYFDFWTSAPGDR
jgi:hypothetical protein